MPEVLQQSLDVSQQCWLLLSLLILLLHSQPLLHNCCSSWDNFDPSGSWSSSWSLIPAFDLVITGSGAPELLIGSLTVGGKGCKDIESRMLLSSFLSFSNTSSIYFK